MSKCHQLRYWLAWLWLACLGLMALATALPLPYAPAEPDLQHVALPPFSLGSQHWLGTDAVGRDVLAGLLFGTRTAWLLTLPAVLLAALLGAGLGGAAGFWRNALPLSLPGWLVLVGGLWWAAALPGAWAGLLLLGMAASGWLLGRAYKLKSPVWLLPLDALVQLVMVLLGTVPRLLLALVVAASMRFSIGGLSVLLALVSWPGLARLVRAEMLRVSVLPYMVAARALGLPSGRVWWHHALPAACRPLRTAVPLSLAGVLGLEATLSFLGVGLPPEIISWGTLMSAVRQDLSAWWVFTLPTLALALTSLAIHVLSRPQTKS